MPTEKIEKYLLNLAGEYRVCSELCKRGIFATLTYGNRKSADVYAINKDSKVALRIEVKTSQGKRFVTGLTQKKSGDSPDFWVLVSLQKKEDDAFAERFFVLSHDKLRQIQEATNKRYGTKYRRRHDSEYDFSTGVDSVPLKDVEKHENGWPKIAEALTSLPA